MRKRHSWIWIERRYWLIYDELCSWSNRYPTPCVISVILHASWFIFFSVERMDVRFGELIGAGPGAYTETVGLKWLSLFFGWKKPFILLRWKVWQLWVELENQRKSPTWFLTLSPTRLLLLLVYMSFFFPHPCELIAGFRANCYYWWRNLVRLSCVASWSLESLTVHQPPSAHSRFLWIKGVDVM